MPIYLHDNDVPDNFKFNDVVAIDCETLGLNPHRDRLCLIQISNGDGNAHLIKIRSEQKNMDSMKKILAPNLCSMLSDRKITKLFHFARFDVAVLYSKYKVLASPIFCTKIASKLVRTYTDKHGLKNLVQEILDIDISKRQQSSDWGAENLSESQKEYAASDVLYLHKLMSNLEKRLEREKRSDLAKSCFSFLPDRSRLDIEGWKDEDIFSH